MDAGDPALFAAVCDEFAGRLAAHAVAPVPWTQLQNVAYALNRAGAPASERFLRQARARGRRRAAARTARPARRPSRAGSAARGASCAAHQPAQFFRVPCQLLCVPAGQGPVQCGAQGAHREPMACAAPYQPLKAAHRARTAALRRAAALAACWASGFGRRAGRRRKRAPAVA